MSDFDLAGWLHTTLLQAQQEAVETATAAGAVALRHVDTTFTPDGNGGYIINFEWEMGVPRG